MRSILLVCGAIIVLAVLMFWLALDRLNNDNWNDLTDIQEEGRAAAINYVADSLCPYPSGERRTAWLKGYVAGVIERTKLFEMPVPRFRNEFPDPVPLPFPRIQEQPHPDPRAKPCDI